MGCFESKILEMCHMLRLLTNSSYFIFQAHDKTPWMTKPPKLEAEILELPTTRNMMNMPEMIE